MSSLSLFKALSFPLDKPYVQIYCVGVLLCLHLQSSEQLLHINGCKGQSDLAIKPQMTNISSCRSASLSILCFLGLDKEESLYPKEGFLLPGNGGCRLDFLPVLETKHTTWDLLFSVLSLFAKRFSCNVVSAFYFCPVSGWTMLRPSVSFTLLLHSCSLLICLDSRVTSCLDFHPLQFKSVIAVVWPSGPCLSAPSWIQLLDTSSCLLCFSALWLRVFSGKLNGGPGESQADLIILTRGEKPNILNSGISTRSFQRFQRAKTSAVKDVLTDRLREKEAVEVETYVPSIRYFLEPPPGVVSRVRSFKITTATTL